MSDRTDSYNYHIALIESATEILRVATEYDDVDNDLTAAARALLLEHYKYGLEIMTKQEMGQPVEVDRASLRQCYEDARKAREAIPHNADFEQAWAALGEGTKDKESLLGESVNMSPKDYLMQYTGLSSAQADEVIAQAKLDAEQCASEKPMLPQPSDSFPQGDGVGTNDEFEKAWTEAGYDGVPEMAVKVDAAHVRCDKCQQFTSDIHAYVDQYRYLHVCLNCLQHLKDSHGPV